MTSTKRAGEDYVYPLPSFRALPPLPPVRTVDPDKYMGPTEESNWVVYTRLLVGAYPSSTHDPVNTAILSSILKLGITTFVCLQQEYQHEGVTEAEWRAGHKLRPYIFDAIKLVDSLPPSYFPTQIKPDGLEFVHFPIVDCAIANDASVLQLCHDLCARLLKGEVMYVHCFTEDHEILTENGFMSIKELESLWNNDNNNNNNNNTKKNTNRKQRKQIHNVRSSSSSKSMVRIASYNQATKQIIYEPCLDVVIKPSHIQTMIEITEPQEERRWRNIKENNTLINRPIPNQINDNNNNGIDTLPSTAGYSFIVTPDHDMFTHVSSSSSDPSTSSVSTSTSLFTKQKASRLYSLHTNPSEPINIHMLTSASQGVNIPSKSLLIEDIMNYFQFTTKEQFSILCYILGRYISSLPYLSTSISHNIDNDNNSSSSFFVMTHNNTHHQQEIIDLLHELGISVSTVQKDNQGGIWIYTPYLTAWLHRQVPPSSFKSYSYNESSLASSIIPIVTLSATLRTWLYELTLQPLQQFLHGLSFDNSLPSSIPSSSNVSNECVIFTDSIPYRDTLLHLCLHAGYSAYFDRYPSTSISSPPLWTVKFTNNPSVTHPVLSSAISASSSFTGMRQVPYTGRTWCVTVPSGLIIARRIQRNPSKPHEIIQASRPTIVGNCWGGHGRTGTVVSIMLGLIYGLSPLDAMRWVQFCHDLRIAPMGTASPQTETQRQQVIRVLNAVRQAQGIPKNPKNNSLLSPQPIPVSSRTSGNTSGNGINLLKTIENANKKGNGTNASSPSSSSSSSSPSNELTGPTYTVEIPAPANVVAMASDITRNVSTAVVKPRSGSVPGRNNPVVTTNTSNVASNNSPTVPSSASAVRPTGNSLTPQGKVSGTNTSNNNTSASPRTRRLSGLPNNNNNNNSSLSSSSSGNTNMTPSTSTSSVAGSGLNAVSNNTRPRNIVALTASQQQIQQQLKQASSANASTTPTVSVSESSAATTSSFSTVTVPKSNNNSSSVPTRNTNTSTTNNPVSSPVRSVHTQSYEATTTDTKIDTLPHYDATGLLNIHSPRPEIATDLLHEPSTAAVLSDPRATAIAPLASSTATMLGINKTRVTSSGNIMTGNKQNRNNSITTNSGSSSSTESTGTTLANNNTNSSSNNNSWAAIVSSSSPGSSSSTTMNNVNNSSLPKNIVNSPVQPKINDNNNNNTNSIIINANRRPVTADNNGKIGSSAGGGVPSPTGKLALTPTKMDTVHSISTASTTVSPSNTSTAPLPSPEKLRVATAKVRLTNTNGSNPPTPNKPTLTPNRSNTTVTNNANNSNGSPNSQVMTGVMRAGTGNVITSSITSASPTSTSNNNSSMVSPRPQTAITPSSVQNSNNSISNSNAARLTTPPLTATRTNHLSTSPQNSILNNATNGSALTNNTATMVLPINSLLNSGSLSVATPTTVSTSTPKETGTPTNHTPSANVVSPTNRGYASAAAAGLASAIAAYSPSSRPGMNNNSIPSRARIAVARQLREPHTASENASRTNNSTTTSGGDKKDMVSRNMLFRSPIPKTSEKSTLPPPGSILPNNSNSNDGNNNNAFTNNSSYAVPSTTTNMGIISSSSPKPTVLPSGGSYMAAAVARKAIQSPNLNNNNNGTNNVPNESKAENEDGGRNSNSTTNNSNPSNGSTGTPSSSNRPRVRVIMRNGSGVSNEMSNSLTDSTTLPSSIVPKQQSSTEVSITSNENNGGIEGINPYGNGILPIGLLPGYIPQNNNKNSNNNTTTMNTNGINVKVRPLGSSSTVTTANPSTSV